MNWTEYGSDQPTYINLVRHPVAQFASTYYFKRFGWDSNTVSKTFGGSDQDRDMSMDQCVEEKMQECVEPSFTLMKDKFLKNNKSDPKNGPKNDSKIISK